MPEGPTESRRNRRRTVVAVGFAIWCWLSFAAAVKFGLVDSYIQDLVDSDYDTVLGCQAVWVGPRLDALGFQSGYKAERDGGTAFAIVVDVPSMECYEGRYFDDPRGESLGKFSPQLVNERLAKALPKLTEEQVAALASDVQGVLEGLRTRGLAAMTFWSDEQGGGLAEGRLHVFNAYGEPGEAIDFRFRRIGLTWLGLTAVGAGVAWLLRGRRTRPADA